MRKRRFKRITLTDIVVWGIGLSIAIGVIYGSIITLVEAKYRGQPGRT